MLKKIEDKAKLMIDVIYKVREMLYSDEADEEIIDKYIDESEVYIDLYRVITTKINPTFDCEKRRFEVGYYGNQ